jgi:hypothetical protein
MVGCSELNFDPRAAPHPALAGLSSACSPSHALETITEPTEVRSYRQLHPQMGNIAVIAVFDERTQLPTDLGKRGRAQCLVQRNQPAGQGQVCLRRYSVTLVSIGGVFIGGPFSDSTCKVQSE